MAEYGPETAGARDLLKQILVARINQIWPEESDAPVTPEAISHGNGIEAVQAALLALSPKNDAQRWLQSTALGISQSIARTRWTLRRAAGQQPPVAVPGVVVFWLAIIFASFGLFAPRNASVMAALLVAALSVAGSIFLILEMDQPYRGLVKISSAPLRTALQELGQQ